MRMNSVSSESDLNSVEMAGIDRGATKFADQSFCSSDANEEITYLPGQNNHGITTIVEDEGPLPSTTMTPILEEDEMMR